MFHSAHCFFSTVLLFLFISLVHGFFFLGSKEKIVEETILAVGFAHVCFFFFFFIFFFLVVVGLMSVGVVGFVINVVVVGVDVVVEVVIDIDGGGFDECGYGWICD